MNTHSIELDGYYARSRGNSTIYLGTAGSHGNEQLQVTLGKGWEGLTVQVVFHPSKVAVQLPANGLLDVPWEATAQPLTAMQGRIVFQGFDQDRLVNSTDLAYTIASHSATVGRDEEPYTPGIVEGVLNQMAADKDAILQAAQQTGQAKEAAAASAAEAAGSAAKAQQSAGAANTSAGQAAASASQAAGSAAAAGETLTQVQTAGQEAQQKVKDSETEALDKIAAAAPALPAVSSDAAWQSVTVKPDGTGYNLAALAPIEATIRPTVTGNPAVCENSAAWGLQGLKIYGKSVQNGTPSPENPVPIVSAGENGSITIANTGKNLFPTESYDCSNKRVATIETNMASEGQIPFVAHTGQKICASFFVSGDVLIAKNIFLCFIKQDQTVYNVLVEKVTNRNRIEAKIILQCDVERVGIVIYPKEGVFPDGYKISNIQVEFGDAITEYEPYVSQYLTLSTPNGLPGIPVTSGGNYMDSTGQQWMCDETDFGAETKTQICAEETIKGTPNFIETSDIAGRFIWTNALSTLFKNGAAKSLSNFGNWNNWGSPMPGESVFALSGKMVYFSPATEMSADEVNSMFAQMIASETPPTILGQLETPVITTLSTEEIAAYRTLTTYSGTTMVSAAEHVAGLEVQYVADSTKYAEKVQSMESRLAALEAAQTGI